jgi:HD-GYP domain-containing protein (c-di-GMP phosphodiesterase class II)
MYGMNENLRKLSDDPRVARLLQDIVEQFQRFSESQAQHIKTLAAIGQSMSEEEDTARVLDMILSEARRFNDADGGTLYLVNRESASLDFLVLHNESLHTFMGGTSGRPVTVPSVPLKRPNGEPNTAHVSAYVANTGAVVDIPDVYAAEGFDFTGTREFDAKLGYRSVSMRVLPMRDHEEKILGVLQLINSIDPDTGRVVPFDPKQLQITLALASQAAVVLNQQHLKGLVTELTAFSEEQARSISELAAIGKALSAEHDTQAVLEMILTQSRRFTHADGGTLYLLNEDKTHLDFHVLHNDTLKSHMGGTSGNPITLPSVALLNDDGLPNDANVSAFVANSAQVVNIPDVYQALGFNFEGTKKFDEATGYRSKSMLVVPMRDHEEQIIGVLQLINAQNPETGETVAFDPEQIEITAALASQAAVVLTQQRLIQDLKNLFESFIRAIATAIDEKSKYTGGHISRVTELTMMIAEKVNEVEDGPFGKTEFTADELEELRIAAWMHDTGKITTPEYVVDKANKLETIFDRVAQVQTRWQAIRLERRVAALEKKLELAKQGLDPEKAAEVDALTDRELAVLNEDLEFLETTNKGGEFMTDEALERLTQIGARTYPESDGDHRFLTDDEIENLSIRKGTLTAAERKVIENHAAMSIKILNQLAWPRKLKGVPAIAGAHHEKLDGSGYPLGLKAEEISLPSRIMAVADIFEALSARDRPYKKPMPLSQAVKILGFMVKDGHIDPDVVDLFVRSGLVQEYAEKHLSKEQIADYEPPPPPEAE